VRIQLRSSRDLQRFLRSDRVVETVSRRLCFLMPGSFPYEFPGLAPGEVTHSRPKGHGTCEQNASRNQPTFHEFGNTS
jgi:hypothetical protein